ncbi:MAG: hypothetical protein PWP33_774 [Thermodesulfobacterium sp.]|jgi:amphi-Trp domain-containing protein|nr:hypothetical protein [Thermodesulfobacterium sp.]
MKDKIEVKKIATPQEAAQLLRQIAEEVEKGKIKIEQVEIDLPANFECELKYKVKEDKKEFEIEFTWRS